jgi:hypothetical protein
MHNRQLLHKTELFVEISGVTLQSSGARQKIIMNCDAHLHQIEALLTGQVKRRESIRSGSIVTTTPTR